MILNLHCSGIAPVDDQSIRLLRSKLKPGRGIDALGI